jgi:hypothetical protein
MENIIQKGTLTIVKPCWVPAKIATKVNDNYIVSYPYMFNEISGEIIFYKPNGESVEEDSKTYQVLKTQLYKKNCFLSHKI